MQSENQELTCAIMKHFRPSPQRSNCIQNNSYRYFKYNGYYHVKRSVSSVSVNRGEAVDAISILSSSDMGSKISFTGSTTASTAGSVASDGVASEVVASEVVASDGVASDGVASNGTTSNSVASGSLVSDSVTWVRTSAGTAVMTSSTIGFSGFCWSTGSVDKMVSDGTAGTRCCIGLVIDATSISPNLPWQR